LPAGIEFIDGLFQAIAVRSGGFYVVAIPSVRISLQVLYVIMMYISAFPIAITIRNSNVYEERSLGIYADDPGYDSVAKAKGSAIGWLKQRFGLVSEEPTKRYFVQQQLRAQLAHDLWWLVLAVFLIMIIEGGQFESNPAVFSVFNVIFEVVSGKSLTRVAIRKFWIN
jgi:Trk-type K+ transport system membrane component